MKRRIGLALLLIAPLAFANEPEEMPVEEEYHGYLMTGFGVGARFIPNIGETMLFIPTMNLHLGTMLNDRNFIMVSAEHELPLGSITDAQWFDVGLKIGALASKDVGVYTYFGQATLSEPTFNAEGGPSYGIGGYMKFYQLGVERVDAVVDMDLRIMHESLTDRPVFSLSTSVSAALF